MATLRQVSPPQPLRPFRNPDHLGTCRRRSAPHSRRRQTRRTPDSLPFCLLAQGGIMIAARDHGDKSWAPTLDVALSLIVGVFALARNLPNSLTLIMAVRPARPCELRSVCI